MTYPPPSPQQPYPPHPYGPYGPPPPPKKKRRWPLFVGIPLALIVFVSCVAAIGSSGTSNDTSTASPAPAATAPAAAAPAAPASGAPAPAPAGPAAPNGPLQHPEDVQVTSCQREPTLGWPKAQLTITNNSSKASTYSVRVSFQSQDGKTQYGEGYALVSSLAPGQTSPKEAPGFAEIPADAALACVVTSAQRTAA